MAFLLPRKRLVMCVHVPQACTASISTCRHRNRCCVKQGKDTTRKYPSASIGKHNGRNCAHTISPVTHVCPLRLTPPSCRCFGLTVLLACRNGTVSTPLISWVRTLLCSLSCGSTISAPHSTIVCLIGLFTGRELKKNPKPVRNERSYFSPVPTGFAILESHNSAKWQSWEVTTIWKIEASVLLGLCPFAPGENWHDMIRTEVWTKSFTVC